MANLTRETIIRLEREYPDWQVWVVPRAAGGNLWCARLWTDHRHVLNEDSAVELEQRLADVR